MVFLIYVSGLYVVPLIGCYLLFTRAEWKHYKISSKGDFISPFIVHIIFFTTMILCCFNALVRSLFDIHFWIIWMLYGIVTTSFLSLFSGNRASSPKVKTGQMTTKLRVVMIGLICFLNLSPIVFYSVGASACYFNSVSNSQALIEVLEVYHNDYGFYPENFNELEMSGYRVEGQVRSNCLSGSHVCDADWYAVLAPESVRKSGSLDLYLLFWAFGIRMDYCS